jgi:hypothetical protein
LKTWHLEIVWSKSKKMRLSVGCSPSINLLSHLLLASPLSLFPGQLWVALVVVLVRMAGLVQVVVLVPVAQLVLPLKTELPVGLVMPLP